MENATRVNAAPAESPEVVAFKKPPAAPADTGQAEVPEARDPAELDPEDVADWPPFVAQDFHDALAAALQAARRVMVTTGMPAGIRTDAFALAPILEHFVQLVGNQID